jgi:NADPH-dependent curcumin reductase CurA
MNIVMMRLSVRGFIVTDYLSKARETIQMFIQAVKDGKLKIGDENEHVVPTKFEDIPKTWLQLFEGGNRGKLITKIE